MTPSKRVLIVDDDPDMTRLLEHHFKTTVFAATAVNDPLQAMPIVQRQDIRIMLLDIDMPQKNGLDLLHEIKAYDPTIAVVMITGHETLSNLTRAFHSGADYIVIKPLKDFSRLLELIQRCQDRLDHWHEMIEAVRAGGAAKN